MICQHCGKKNEPIAVFCVQCSQPLRRICPTCSTQNPGDALFCMKCRTDLNQASETTQASRLQEMRDSASKALQEKLRIAQSEIEGQRKPVTILFTDIVGSTAITERLDPEVWSEIVAGAHRRVGKPA